MVPASFLKFLRNYCEYMLSTLLAGQKNYEQWKEKNYRLCTTQIKNKQLADEIEKACEKNGGFLTYAQFLEIDQFGSFGYHATHACHGITGSHRHWAEAIATLVKKEGLGEVVEVGSGEGSLAIDAVRHAKKKNHDLFWTCIEINKTLQKTTIERFAKKNLQKHLKAVVSTIDTVPFSQKCLGVFSYSLDSIPPEIFINTKEGKHMPTNLLGITVKNGILCEIVLSEEQLRQRHMQLCDGYFTDAYGNIFDLTSWLLYNGQRAYISLPAFSLLTRFIKKMPVGSILVIIDEFRDLPTPWETNHLLIPKDLLMYKRELGNLEKAYEDGGNQLYYFPSYNTTMEKLIQALGCNVKQAEIEQKLAYEIVGKRWFGKPGAYYTYALLTSPKVRTIRKILPVVFPVQSLL